MKYTFLQNRDAAAFLGDDFEISYEYAYSIIRSISERIPEDGMHVAIFAENSPEWACAIYATWLRGGTVVPMDANLSAKEAAFILNDSDSSFVFTSRKNSELAMQAIALTGKNIGVCVLDDVEKLFNSRRDCEWKIECPAEALAFIVYTSGTTSNPKGVMLTFDNLQANIEAVAEEGYYYENMRMLAMLPFHHILPLVGTILGVLYVGGSIVLPRSVAPADIASVLQKRKATIAISVPRFYELLHANIMEKVGKSALINGLFMFAKFAGSMKLSRLIFKSIHDKFGGKVDIWVSGGASLSREINADLHALGFDIREGYGMTEAAPIIAFPRMNHYKIGACGQPLNANEVRIVDGEITVRGRSITQGYYKRPDENASSFQNGWFYTGDLGYFDDENFLFITGRRKEIIVLPNGKKLNPLELEEQLKEKSADIEEVGVLMYDDILQAVVRLKPEKYAALGQEGAREFVRENVILPYNRSNASYKRIIRFTVVTAEFPRTRIGKIKRFQLAAFVDNIKDEAPELADLAPEPDSEVYRQIKQFLAMQVSVPILPDSHIEMDLGLDSLGKLAMHEFIKENYSIDMSETELENNPTPRKVADFIESKRQASEAPKAQAGNSEHKVKTLQWGEILKNHTPPAIPKTYFFHAFTILAARVFFKLWYNIKIEGHANLKRGQAVIITPNHQSLCDGFFFANLFSMRELFHMYFFAKVRSMMRSSAMKFFVRHSNIIVVDVKTNVRESVQKLAEILRRGDKVVMFPEGTRTRDGKVAEFKSTFAILSKELKVPVIPMSISGAYEALKSRTSIPPRGTAITIKLGEPMMPADDETYQEFAERVRAAVVALKDS